MESQRHSPSNRSRLRRLVGGGLALAAAGASYHLIPLWPMSGTQAVAGTPPAEQAMPASVATLEPREAILWDEFSGRLEAVDRIDVRARVGGAVQATHFAEGELVKAGDLLVSIDPAPYAAEVQRLEAQVAGAEARVAMTSSDLERGQRLSDQHIVTARDLDVRANAFKEAKASLDAAKAALEAARLNLGYTQVRAAVSGRVGRREITPGNLVATGAGAPVLTTLVSVDPVYASFDADEGVVLKALASIAEPAGGRGKLDRIPVEMATADGTQAKGHLQFIDNKVDARSGTIRVRATFANGDGRLIPGQFARMRLGQAAPGRLLLVDERAVGTDQDKKFVLVVGADNRATFRVVTLGRAVEGLRVVTSGLAGGERIVVNGLQRIRPGTLVQPEPVAMGGRPQDAASGTRQLAQR
ncbi:Efflux pump periplasmic linker BepF [Methylobacterium tardum]|uniref:MexE family multidrug efflux RND transporter periplasmic adaptor subunit n=1 Tax=Methylobacterium tardum TaxID=374432 RepID=A0AA37TIH5_9HYPH|nr:efflux RND transporter periplasmic adaptor subunit [Methylobacterium tardum]URD35851.1 efflux RND transporter periplasmic adaptor subunit [Methylobacterium tardum]GJE51859.1 Efflux pump periplasmic linker BepF [Methylobacterium tardum]GLS72285.1 MexE family multidrug efflux RND transporter periplasmic adaptor subunit [Methylobacterium tardum]